MERVTLTFDQCRQLYNQAKALDTDQSDFLSRQEAVGRPIALPAELTDEKADPYKTLAYVYYYYPQISAVGSAAPNQEVEIPVTRSPDDLLTEKNAAFALAEARLNPAATVNLMGQSSVHYTVYKNVIKERINVAEILMSIGRLDESDRMFGQALANLQTLRSLAPNSPYYLEGLLLVAEAHYRRGNPEQALPLLTQSLALLNNDEAFFKPLSKTSSLDRDDLVGYRSSIYTLLGEIAITNPVRFGSTQLQLARIEKALRTKFDFYLWTRSRMIMAEDPSRAGSWESIAFLESIFGGKAALLNAVRNPVQASKYFESVARGGGAARLYEQASREFPPGFKQRLVNYFARPVINVDLVIKAALLLGEFYRNQGDREGSLQIANGVLAYQEIMDKPFFLGKALYLKSQTLLSGDNQSAAGTKAMRDALAITQFSSAFWQAGSLPNLSNILELGSVTYEATFRLNREALGRLVKDQKLTGDQLGQVVSLLLQGSHDLSQKTDQAFQQAHPELATIAGISPQLAPFFRSPQEYWNNTIVVYELYAQAAIESSKPGQVDAAVTSFHALLEQLDKQSANTPLAPALHLLSSLKLTGASLIAQQELSDPARVKQAVTYTLAALNTILPARGSSVSRLDYVNLTKGCLILAALYVKDFELTRDEASLQKAERLYTQIARLETGPAIELVDLQRTVPVDSGRVDQALDAIIAAGYITADQKTRAKELIFNYFVGNALLHGAALVNLAPGEKPVERLQAASAAIDRALGKIGSEQQEPFLYNYARLVKADLLLTLHGQQPNPVLPRQADELFTRAVAASGPQAGEGAAPRFPYLYFWGLVKQVERQITNTTYINEHGQPDPAHLINLIEQAKTARPATGPADAIPNYLVLELDHLNAILLIIRNKAGDQLEAIKLANRVKDACRRLPESMNAVQAYFRDHADLKIAEALIQARDANETTRRAALALLGISGATADQLIKEGAKGFVREALNRLKALEQTTGAYAYLLKDKGRYITELLGRSDLKEARYQLSVLRRMLINGPAPSTDNLNAEQIKQGLAALGNDPVIRKNSEAYQQYTRALGWNFHTFLAELDHQLALAHSLLKSKELPLEYGFQAYRECDLSGSRYDLDFRPRIIEALIKKPKPAK
ncbi:MAG: tetratricopeptide repeat protein [Candidatus Margulisbacteria bacterium]|jgi:tetratricopeptide (TPR) repeat protein|nr:tetratricopeptide repeat protein [Candidatus Margulisiibacteriota bacterium]